VVRSRVFRQRETEMRLRLHPESDGYVQVPICYEDSSAAGAEDAKFVKTRVIVGPVAAAGRRGNPEDAKATQPEDARGRETCNSIASGSGDAIQGNLKIGRRERWRIKAPGQPGSGSPGARDAARGDLRRRNLAAAEGAGFEATRKTVCRRAKGTGKRGDPRNRPKAMPKDAGCGETRRTVQRNSRKMRRGETQGLIVGLQGCDA
jgi:hypothetical protein